MVTSEPTHLDEFMTDETSIRFQVRFEGRVQGVGFRMTTVSLAQGLDVQGTVRNEHDGSVLLDIEGDRKTLERLISRIQREMADNIRSTRIDERPIQNQSGGLRISH